MERETGKSKKTNRCRICDKPCLRKYCSPEHRQKHYRIRKALKVIYDTSPLEIQILNYGVVLHLTKSHMVPKRGLTTEYHLSNAFSVRLIWKA